MRPALILAKYTIEYKRKVRQRELTTDFNALSIFQRQLPLWQAMSTKNQWSVSSIARYLITIDSYPTEGTFSLICLQENLAFLKDFI